MISPRRQLNTALWITRKKRGLSRKKLASLLGARYTDTIWRWETGRSLPTLENALLLSAFLSMPVEYLFRELRENLLAGALARGRFARDETRIDSMRFDFASRSEGEAIKKH